MSYNVKNYTEQGGEITHIGGSLIIEEGASVQGLPSPSIPTASAETAGVVKVGSGLSISNGVLSADGITPAENMTENSSTTAASIRSDFNALLAKLKAAGLMEADPVVNTPEPASNEPS